jgi:hypothetical protein
MQIKTFLLFDETIPHHSIIISDHFSFMLAVQPLNNEGIT